MALGPKEPRLASRHDMFETRQNILGCQLNAVYLLAQALQLFAVPTCLVRAWPVLIVRG